MILTDGLHVVSTTSVGELHHFAGKVGLPLRWFQDRRIPHYDVWGRMREQPLVSRSRRVSTRELVRRAVRREPSQP